MPPGGRCFYRVKALGPEPDRDGDLLDTWEEGQLGTNPDASDTDADKISDSTEYLAGLNPSLNIDSEPDGLPDDWERFHFGGLGQAALDNYDSDPLTNKDEFDLNLDPKTNESASSALRIEYTYDALGRLTGATAPGTSSAVYSFDPEGNILAAQ
jgi:hypothetical protein